MSVINSILSAIKTRIDSQGYEVTGNVPVTSVIRKKVSVRSGDVASLPMIQIVPVRRRKESAMMEDKEFVWYTITVVIIRQNDAKLSMTDDSIKSIQEDIEKLLEGPNGLPAVTVVNDIDIDPAAEFDVARIDKSYDYVPIMVVVNTIESRGT